MFVGHHQRTASQPEFGARIDVDDLGAGVGRQAAGQDAIGPAADRIRPGRIAERKLIARIQMVFLLAVKATRLGKRCVQENTP